MREGGGTLPGAPSAPFAVTPSGREALRRILRHLQPRGADEVWIVTTMGLSGLHVTPCVTATIAEFCRFAFQPGPRTVAVLVIHDYGVLYPHLDLLHTQCRKQGWPLVEDAAHAFASRDVRGRRAGTTGDFAIYSLPKFFPVPRGGLAVGLPPAAGDSDRALAYLFQRWQPATARLAARCRRNWHSLDAAVQTMGLQSALPLLPGAVPSLYVLRTVRQFATIRHLRAAGIACGPDVACGRVLIPCHSGVQDADLAAIIALIGAAQGTVDAASAVRRGVHRPVRLYPGLDAAPATPSPARAITGR